jgi:hypothetical protein
VSVPWIVDLTEGAATELVAATRDEALALFIASGTILAFSSPAVLLRELDRGWSCRRARWKIEE